VVEDADILLTDRKHEGNKTMAKLLNVSDGLVKVANKKVIFTANLKTKREIDPALTRAGRCFDVVNFRDLTKAEAKLAAEVSGIADPEKSLPLCELFDKDYEEAVRNHDGSFKVGFV